MTKEESFYIDAMFLLLVIVLLSGVVTTVIYLTTGHYLEAVYAALFTWGAPQLIRITAQHQVFKRFENDLGGLLVRVFEGTAFTTPLVLSFILG